MATSIKSSSSTPLRFVAAILIARLASGDVSSDRATVELSDNSTTTLLANTEADPPFYEEAQKAYNLIENVLNRKCYEKKETPAGNPVRGVGAGAGGGGPPGGGGDDVAGEDTGDDIGGDTGGDAGAPAPAPYANETESLVQSSSKRSSEPTQLSDPDDISQVGDEAEPYDDGASDTGGDVAPAATPETPAATGGGDEGGEEWDESNRTSIKPIPDKDSEKGATPVVVAQIVPRSCENNNEILEALRPLVEQRLQEAKEALAAVKEQDAALQAIINKEKAAAEQKKGKLEAMATVIQTVVDKLTAFPGLDAFGKEDGKAIIVDPNPKYHGGTGGAGDGGDGGDGGDVSDGGDGGVGGDDDDPDDQSADPSPAISM